MIDQVSNKGYARLSLPATVSTSGAGSAVLNLLLGPGGTGFVNSPTNGQPQGTIAFIMDTTAVTGNGTYIATIQTAPDNATWSNVGSAFVTASNVANTGGLQVLFIDSAALNTYVRSYDTLAANTSVVRSISAVFVPKNP